MAIKFGIMCNHFVFPYWQVKCIDYLLDTGAELSLIICNKIGSQPKGLMTKTKKLLLLYYLYDYFILRHSKSMQLVCLEDNFELSTKINCQTEFRDKYSQYFTEDDIATIRSYRLDFIIRFGFGIIRGDILESAQYGIWSFHHDNEEKYRGSPPGFWEIYHDDPVTGCVLQRLTNRLDSGVILKKGFIKTINTSYADNRDNVFIKGTKWPAQISLALQNGDKEIFLNQQSQTTAPIYKRPSNIQMIYFLSKLVKNKLLFCYKNIFS